MQKEVARVEQFVSGVETRPRARQEERERGGAASLSPPVKLSTRHVTLSKNLRTGRNFESLQLNQRHNCFKLLEPVVADT